MAIYKFKVSFEDYDVTREIDIRSNQTFEDLHLAIHRSIGYKPDVPSSFYSSNDQWHKGQEITIYPNEKKEALNIALMSNSKLLNFIEDPHQKFYYTSNFDRPFDFHVELVRILIEADPKLTYPAVLKSSGEPPRQFSSAPVVIPKTDEPPGIAALLAEETEENETVNAFSIADLGTDDVLDEDDEKTLVGTSSLDVEEEGQGSGDVSETAEGGEDDFGSFGLDPDEDHRGKEDYKEDY